MQIEISIIVVVQIEIRLKEVEKHFIYDDGADDVVYCDPPFRLREAALIAASSGAKVIISNHDTENTRELYREANIVSLEARRSIERDSACRKPVKEILAIFECVPF